MHRELKQLVRTGRCQCCKARLGFSPYAKRSAGFQWETCKLRKTTPFWWLKYTTIYICAFSIGFAVCLVQNHSLYLDAALSLIPAAVSFAIYQMFPSISSVNGNDAATVADGPYRESCADINRMTPQELATSFDNPGLRTNIVIATLSPPNRYAAGGQGDNPG
jgi:hypothetical protein